MRANVRFSPEFSRKVFVGHMQKKIFGENSGEILTGDLILILNIDVTYNFFLIIQT